MQLDFAIFYTTKLKLCCICHTSTPFFLSILFPIEIIFWAFFHENEILRLTVTTFFVSSLYFFWNYVTYHLLQHKIDILLHLFGTYFCFCRCKHHFFPNFPDPKKKVLKTHEKGLKTQKKGFLPQKKKILRFGEKEVFFWGKGKFFFW